MNRFLGKLTVTALFPAQLKDRKSDRQIYRLEADFAYQSERFGIIVVPAGTETDFASIPRAVWNIVDPEDPIMLMPSVPHDWGYQNGGLLQSQTMTRQHLDELLVEMMVTQGAGPIIRKLVYGCVRTFGGSHWTEPKRFP